MTAKRLKIAYLCDHSPLDKNLYSGGNARIFNALQKHVGDVDILPANWGALAPLRRAIHRLPEKYILRLGWRVHLALAPLINRSLSRQLAKGGYDVLFGAYSFHALRGVKLPVGMVSAYTSDATPTTYKQSQIGQSFQQISRFARLFDPLIQRAEKQVFTGVDHLFWPSLWIRDAVVKLHDLPPGRNLVLPWGANIDDPGTARPPAIGTGPLNLLVVGRNWFAKGGPMAFETLQILRAQGVDARLTVVGCTPPDFHRNDRVQVHPQLDKAVPDQLATFTQCFRQAHFLVMPSMESYGFAFCEASAYGLPSLCYQVGGVPVRDGVNGHALPLGAKAADFAKVICGYLDAPERYAELRKTTREEYEARLNWDAWGMAVAKALQQKVETP
jgi:glycosyltransferase involved in cell wall biosynthesis